MGRDLKIFREQNFFSFAKDNKIVTMFSLRTKLITIVTFLLWMIQTSLAFYGGFGGGFGGGYGGGGGQWIGPFPIPIPYGGGYGSAARSSAEILIPSVAIGLILVLRR